jgi:hypothetical protein
MHEEKPQAMPRTSVGDESRLSKGRKIIDDSESQIDDLASQPNLPAFLILTMRIADFNYQMRENVGFSYS